VEVGRIRGIKFPSEFGGAAAQHVAAAMLGGRRIHRSKKSL
jgi:hypothetical protein